MTFLKKAAMAGAFLAVAPIPVLAGDEADPYRWLEEVEGAEALDWVRAENERSLGVLEADPRFEGLYQGALDILTSTDRLALGAVHNGAVYNFWQDETHVRGLWRRASLKSYRKGKLDWETLIDFDQLADEEERNWIHGGIVCLAPEYRHCMVELSDGGKDAGIWREFDTDERTFAEGGFFLPEAKSNLAWLDQNTLLVGTDTGAEGALTDSGYPRMVRRLGRRAALASAPILYEGEASDVAVGASVEHEGDVAHVFVSRSVSFFETEYYYGRAGSDDLKQLPVPLNADLQGVFDGEAVFFLREPMTVGDEIFDQGSVISLGLESGDVTLVMAASANQSIEDVEIGESNIVVQYLEDVSGKAARLSKGENGEWRSEEIRLPANGVVSIVSAGGGTDAALVSFESMTSPDTLYYVSPKNKVSKIAAAPAFYDASDVIVEQRFATSKDGTRIPYFIMGRKSVLEAGDTPTIQYGYGGFLTPILPVYYEDPARPQHGALAGKLWVARGGVMVLSNIRGGSEYGPAWHEAALKENRQRAFDDFIAISEDLIASGVTSPNKLGAIGRSNGGLLMGAMMTQRPDLYAAIDIGAPLLDMKRYNKLLAGASWMGEYGNPDNPQEWAYISQYSPYQQIKADAGYPEVLFYTSTKDDRVHPGHARKAAAKMADLGYDFFYYENIEGGHGGTANQDQLAYRTALEYVYFLIELMGAPEE